MEDRTRKSGAAQGLAAALLAASVGTTLLGYATPSPAASLSPETKHFAIAAGPLATALNRFAEQSQLLLVYPAELTRDLHTAGVDGVHAPLDAMRILLAGTGLDAELTADGAVTLRRMPEQTAMAAGHTLLPKVRVTADPLREGIYSQPRSVSTIDRTDMDKIGPRHISEILQQIPGVFTATNEQNPSVAVNVRGLKDFGRVNMNIDGIRQNYQLSGHQQRNGEMFVDAELLSGVEVLRGPTSTLGGAGALGGVASFRTLVLDDIVSDGHEYGMRARTSTGVGEFANGNRFTGSLASGWRVASNFDVLAAASYRNLGEYSPGRRGSAIDYSWLTNRGIDLQPGTVNLTDQELASGLFKARWRPASGHELQLSALHTQVEFDDSSFMDMDAAYSYYVTCEGGTVRSPYCDSIEFDPDQLYPQASSNEVRASNIALDYDWTPRTRWIDLHAKLYFADTGNRQSGGEGAAAYRFDSRTRTFGVNLDNTSLFEAGAVDVSLNSGLEFFRDQARPSADSTGLDGAALSDLEGGTPEGDRWVGGVFLNATLNYHDWLQLTPGVRYDRYRVWGNTGFVARDATSGWPLLQYEDIAVDRRQGQWSPTLGMAFTPVEQLQFFANAGRGWRPPAITESLIGGNHPGDPGARYYPNYLLESERSTSVEAGVNAGFNAVMLASDTVRVKTAWFRSKIDDYTFFGGMIGIPGARGPGLTRFMFVNAEAPVYFEGIEFSLRYDAQRWYSSLDYTRIERDGDFSYRMFPLGGATGANAEELNGTIYAAGGGIYNPEPPRDRIVADGGVRLLDRQLAVGARLTCASEGGMAYDGFVSANSFCAGDLYGTYQLLPPLLFGFNLKNLSDRQYLMAMGDAFVRSYAPGRTLLVSAEWKF